MFENVKKTFFLLMGGLALFLFGMANLSESLKSTASARLRKILDRTTSGLFIGLIVGTVVTCLIQSSSAMMALLIGLVNAIYNIFARERCKILESLLALVQPFQTRR